MTCVSFCLILFDTKITWFSHTDRKEASTIVQMFARVSNFYWTVKQAREVWTTKLEEQFHVLAGFVLFEVWQKWSSYSTFLWIANLTMLASYKTKVFNEVKYLFKYFHVNQIIIYIYIPLIAHSDTVINYLLTILYNILHYKVDNR